MEIINESIRENFGDRIRVRACGVVMHHENILMVRHRGLGKDGTLWIPPGGGLGFGENAQEGVIREVREETGLLCEVIKFLFTYEYVHPPLHAVELFFKLKVVSGELETGRDPELRQEEQIIEEVRYLSPDEIKNIPNGQLHGVFNQIDHPPDVVNLTGYILV